MNSTSRATVIGLAGTIAVLGLAGAGGASTLSVDPTQVYLDNDVQTQLLRLRNDSERPTSLQVTVHEWYQTPSGQMELGPTQDLIVFPTLFTIEPGSERQVRVGTVVPPAARERTYRIFIEELPSEVDEQLAVQGVSVRMKMGIPVFHRPLEAVSQGGIDEINVEGGMLTFDIQNTGTVHFAPGSVRVRSIDQSGASVQELELAAWYVLAASERHHEVELNQAECQRVAQVVVEADFEGTVLAASVPTPSACAGVPASN